jgi:hypothetical protein
VDVTGWLGGYNFQWAWSSGFVAGQAVWLRIVFGEFIYWYVYIFNMQLEYAENALF